MSCQYNKPGCSCGTNTSTMCVVYYGELPSNSGINGSDITLDKIIEDLYDRVDELEGGASTSSTQTIVEDVLTSTSIVNSLSANQGRVLDLAKANKSDVYTKVYLDTVLKTKADKDSILSSQDIIDRLMLKVDKETGKGLSTNDFTDTYKDKIDSISSGSGTSVLVINSLMSTSTTDALSANQGYELNRLKSNKSETYTKDEVNTLLGSKVTIESGKMLTSNDFNVNYKTKLDSIQDGATKTVIEDTLTSSSTTNALSANQGKVLSNTISTHTHSDASTMMSGFMSTTDKTKLDGIQDGATKTVINNTLTSTSTTEALSANQGKVLYDNIKITSSTVYKDDVVLTSNLDINSTGNILQIKKLGRQITAVGNINVKLNQSILKGSKAVIRIPLPTGFEASGDFDQTPGYGIANNSTTMMFARNYVEGSNVVIELESLVDIPGSISQIYVTSHVTYIGE